MGSSSIEQAIYTTLTGSTEVTDLLGSRIFFARAERDTAMPYAVFSVVSDPHTPFAFGETNSGNPRIQISIFDDDRYDAIDAAHVIRTVLRNYNGSMDGITVHYCHVEGTRMIPEPDQDIFQATFDVLPIYIDAS